MSTLKFSDVKKCITDFLKLTSYEADNSGFVRVKGSDKPIKVAVNDLSMHLAVFDEIIHGDEDALILNPFAESITQTIEQDWLFEAMGNMLAFRIIDSVKVFARILLSDQDIQLNSDLINLLSKYSASKKKAVGPKIIKEIESVTPNLIDFASVGYRPNLKTCVFRCAIFEPRYRKKFNITKKTWDYLENIITDILGLDGSLPVEKRLDELKYKATVLGYPRLESTLRVFYNVYDRLNVYLAGIDALDDSQLEDGFKRPMAYAVDLDSIGRHIDNLDKYYDLAKAVVQPTASKKSSSTAKVEDLASVGPDLPITPTSGPPLPDTPLPPTGNPLAPPPAQYPYQQNVYGQPYPYQQPMANPYQRPMYPHQQQMVPPQPMVQQQMIPPMVQPQYYQSQPIGGMPIQPVMPSNPAPPF